MALRNIFNGTSFVMQKESIDTFTMSSPLQQITHSIDSATGNYIIKDQNNNVLLAFDKNNNLLSSAVQNSITNSIAPITALIQDLSTSFVSIGGTLGSSQSGSSVSLTTLQNQISTLQTALSALQATVQTQQNYITVLQNTIDITGISQNP